MQKLSDDGLREKLQSLSAQAKSGTSLDDLLPETYALVREAGVRLVDRKVYAAETHPTTKRTDR